MRLMPRFKSLRTTAVFWFVTAAVLPLVATQLYVYVARRAAVREQVLTKLTAVRDMKAAQIRRWLTERVNDSRALGARAADPSSERCMTDPAPGPECARVFAEDSAFAGIFASSHFRGSMMLVEPGSGRIIFTTADTREVGDVAEDPVVLEPVRTGAPYVGEARRDPRTGGVVLPISILIRCTAHSAQHVIGVVVAWVDLDASLGPALSDRAGLGDTGETLIVNREVIALSELRWYAGASLRLKIAAEPAVRAASGLTGTAQTLDYRGVEVLAAYTHIPEAGWGLVAKQDVAEVDQPLRALAVQLALITLVASMAAALLAWILASRLVAPIVGVARAAVSIQGGRMEARTGLGGGSDEVGRLASAVDSMAGALEEEMAVKEGVSALLAAAAHAQDPASLARAILVEAQRLTDCDMCAFFVIERASRDRLVPLASVGVSTELLDSFDASRFEGEFGRALATREITRITDIPADTAFHFKTAAGSLAPREICTVPLVVGNAVEAILSLAAVRGCRGRGLESLARSRQALAEAFERVRLAERHALLSRSLAASNAELSAMNQELEVQADELRQSADELLEQKEELEARRQQVEEADRLKSEFLSNMSHELRTPLNSILTLSQLLLQRDTPSSPEDAEHLRIIERSGRHLLLLINDILDLSKIEAGRMDLDLTEVAPLEVARLALDTVRATALEKGLEIAVSGSDAIPRVESDEQRLKQILLNLLSNAVKFTDRGRVDVRLSAAGEAVAIAVQDTGIGIPPDQLEHIFEEFRQVDGSITRRYGGSGLGLAISRKLAGLLGVTLTVRSVPGEGSCFTLTVPFRWTGAGASAPSARREPAPARAPAEAPSPARILVMEDQAVVARQIHDALRDAGHVVEVALGGAEAIEKAAAAPPDLVVLDLMMPGVDGLSVLARLRRMKETADVPIIILTAKELTRREREIIGRNEIAELITKGSVDRAELLRRIGAQLTPAEPGAVAPALSVAPAATDPAAVPADPLADLALVVEDNPDNVAALGAFLDRIGCPFVVARDGESALALARARRPGLVLLDIQLPGMSGLDVARALRADAAMRHARLVALTAKAMPGDREAALEAGCDEHLAKPLDLQRLEALVRSWRARP